MCYDSITIHKRPFAINRINLTPHRMAILGTTDDFTRGIYSVVKHSSTHPRTHLFILLLHALKEILLDCANYIVKRVDTQLDTYVDPAPRFHVQVTPN